MNPVDRRSAGDNPVEVGRIAHGFGNALPSALRAAVPDRERGTRAIERVDDGLRLDRHLVHRAIGEVGDLLGMSERERAAVADVPGVGGWRSRSLRDGAGERRDTRWCPPIHRCRQPGTCRSSARGQPDFNLDVGVGRRRQRGRHTAERRQRRVRARHLWRCAALSRDARRRERAGGDLLRDGDLGVIERQTRKRLTRRGV